MLILFRSDQRVQRYKQWVWGGTIFSKDDVVFVDHFQKDDDLDRRTIKKSRFLDDVVYGRPLIQNYNVS